MARGREWILEPDLDISAPESSAMIWYFVGHPRLMPRRVLDQQPWFEVVELLEHARGIHAGRVGRRRLSGDGAAPSTAQVAQRAPRDPQQEQVEDREEAELQADRDGREQRTSLQLEGHSGGAELDLVARPDHLRTVDPAPVDRRAVGRPQIRQHPGAATGADLGVLARHVRIAQHHIALAAATERHAGGSDHEPLAVEQQQSCLNTAARLLHQRIGHPLRDAVEQSPTRHVVRRLPSRQRRRLDNAQLDPEFAQPEALVGLKLDHRPRQQRQPLAPRILEQITGELGRQRVLVIREPGAIARRQEHLVLVGDVRSRNREMLVFLHLPREPSGDFDRTHLGAKDTAEGAFDEACDLALKASEHAHGSLRAAALRGLWMRRRRAIPCYASPPAGTADRPLCCHFRSAAGPSGRAALAMAPMTTRFGRARCGPAACTSLSVAAATVAAQVVTSTNERASDRPRTRYGRVPAASAHTTAGASRPPVAIGTSTWWVTSNSEEVHIAGLPAPGGVRV